MAQRWFTSTPPTFGLIITGALILLTCVLVCILAYSCDEEPYGRVLRNNKYLGFYFAVIRNSQQQVGYQSVGASPYHPLNRYVPPDRSLFVEASIHEPAHLQCCRLTQSEHTSGGWFRTVKHINDTSSFRTSCKENSDNGSTLSVHDWLTFGELCKITVGTLQKFSCESILHARYGGLGFRE